VHLSGYFEPSHDEEDDLYGFDGKEEFDEEEEDDDQSEEEIPVKKEAITHAPVK